MYVIWFGLGFLYLLPCYSHMIFKAVSQVVVMSLWLWLYSILKKYFTAVFKEPFIFHSPTNATIIEIPLFICFLWCCCIVSLFLRGTVWKILQHFCRIEVGWGITAMATFCFNTRGTGIMINCLTLFDNVIVLMSLFFWFLFELIAPWFKPPH